MLGEYLVEWILAMVMRNLPVQKYILVPTIMFLISYYHTKNFEIALCVALITLIGYTIYNYSVDVKYVESFFYNNVFFGIYIILVFIVLRNLQKLNKKNYECYVCYINFVILLYVFISFLEYFIHKRIMHCNQKDPVFQFIKKIIPYSQHSCESHMEHHLEVRPNMKLKDVRDEESLTFGWKLFIGLYPVAFIIMYFANLICGTHFSLIASLIISFIVLFFIFYMWNKIHPRFHDYDVKTFSIKSGPHDNGLFKTTFFEKLLYRNHEAHHIQKGEKKGNYNIILLGADEWMDRNVKVIDNKEYCKTHQNEEVCKNLA